MCKQISQLANPWFILKLFILLTIAAPLPLQAQNMEQTRHRLRRLVNTVESKPLPAPPAPQKKKGIVERVKRVIPLVASKTAIGEISWPPSTDHLADKEKAEAMLLEIHATFDRVLFNFDYRNMRAEYLIERVLNGKAVDHVRDDLVERLKKPKLISIVDGAMDDLARRAAKRIHDAIVGDEISYKNEHGVEEADKDFVRDLQLLHGSGRTALAEFANKKVVDEFMRYAKNNWEPREAVRVMAIMLDPNVLDTTAADRREVLRTLIDIAAGKDLPDGLLTNTIVELRLRASEAVKHAATVYRRQHG